MLHIAPLRVPRLWIPCDSSGLFVCLFVCLPRFSVELPDPSYLAVERALPSARHSPAVHASPRSRPSTLGPCPTENGTGCELSQTLWQMTLHWKVFVTNYVSIKKQSISQRANS